MLTTEILINFHKPSNFATLQTYSISKTTELGTYYGHGFSVKGDTSFSALSFALDSNNEIIASFPEDANTIQIKLQNFLTVSQIHYFVFSRSDNSL